jgi:hypothetical protein
VTHPFHPLSGRQFVCLGEQFCRYGTRLLLRIDGARICVVPRKWTDAADPGPEVVIAAGRAPFLVDDLIELAELVSRVLDRAQPRGCKDNSAATVKDTTPHGGETCLETPEYA